MRNRLILYMGSAVVALLVSRVWITKAYAGDSPSAGTSAGQNEGSADVFASANAEGDQATKACEALAAKVNHSMAEMGKLIDVMGGAAGVPPQDLEDDGTRAAQALILSAEEIQARFPDLAKAMSDTSSLHQKVIEVWIRFIEVVKGLREYHLSLSQDASQPAWAREHYGEQAAAFESQLQRLDLKLDMIRKDARTFSEIEQYLRSAPCVVSGYIALGRTHIAEGQFELAYKAVRERLAGLSKTLDSLKGKLADMVTHYEPQKSSSVPSQPNAPTAAPSKPLKSDK